MVRIIAGTLIAIGLGRLPVDAFARGIETGDRLALAPRRRPAGLRLRKVWYPGEWTSDIALRLSVRTLVGFPFSAGYLPISSRLMEMGRTGHLARQGQSSGQAERALAGGGCAGAAGQRDGADGPV